MSHTDPTVRKAYHRNYMREHPRHQTYTPAQKVRRAAVSRARDAKRSRLGAHLQRRYGITLEQYERLLAALGSFGDTAASVRKVLEYLRV
jgi:hypothetical protein